MRMRLLLLQRMSGEGKTKMENPSLERAESTEIRHPEEMHPASAAVKRK